MHLEYINMYLQNNPKHVCKCIEKVVAWEELEIGEETAKGTVNLSGMFEIFCMETVFQYNLDN